MTDVDIKCIMIIIRYVGLFWIRYMPTANVIDNVVVLLLSLIHI